MRCAHTQPIATDRRTDEDDPCDHRFCRSLGLLHIEPTALRRRRLHAIELYERREGRGGDGRGLWWPDLPQVSRPSKLSVWERLFQWELRFEHEHLFCTHPVIRRRGVV